jgi:hypothetical protein
MTPPCNDYRDLRRAFIAACEARGLDAIARVHPQKAPDGKPLFMDCVALVTTNRAFAAWRGPSATQSMNCVALGPRHAAKALLVVTSDAAGSRLLTALLQDGASPPPDARLVLVHALDPAGFAGTVADPAWSAAMLRAVMTEDLAKVAQVSVLVLGDDALVARALADASVTIAQAPADAAAVSRILALLAGL